MITVGGFFLFVCLWDACNATYGNDVEDNDATG